MKLSIFIPVALAASFDDDLDVVANAAVVGAEAIAQGGSFLSSPLDAVLRRTRWHATSAPDGRESEGMFERKTQAPVTWINLHSQ